MSESSEVFGWSIPAWAKMWGLPRSSGYHLVKTGEVEATPVPGFKNKLIITKEANEKFAAKLLSQRNAG